jgi:hypothetical protein
VDYRERRSHASMLEDQDNTEHVKQFKQPSAIPSVVESETTLG